MTTPDAIHSRRAFQEGLLRWYDANHRKLPWRTEPSLYRTVVSEFMLQQTQVATVLPYFDAWLRQFPDFEALAKAREDTVVKAWEGLGYYRRARNLHGLAQAYVTALAKPETAEQWQALPGVGPYTAAAIASINHGEEIAVVDGNVVRILARLFAQDTEFKDAATAGRILGPLAQKLIARVKRPGDYNQAIMELGATICARGKPLCLLCPVRLHCRGWAVGTPEKWPRLAPKAAKKIVIDRCWVEKSGKLLLRQAPVDARRLAGICELPEAAYLGYDPGREQPILIRKRGIANENIEERIYQADYKQVDAKQPHLRWVTLDALDSVTLSGPHKKWIAYVLGGKKDSSHKDTKITKVNA